MAKRKPRYQSFRAEIVDVSHEGRGVARVDGKTVFVHGALKGEDVTFTTYRRKRSFDEAITDEVHTASEFRVEPRCEAYGVCGGCSLQHLDIEQQRTHKREHLAHEFQKAAVKITSWLPDLHAQPWQYRRRGRLGVKNVAGKGRVLVGFRERKAPYIADMHRCEILAEPVGGLLDALSDVVGQLSISSRLPQIEVAVGDDITALVFRILDPLTSDDEQILAKFGVANDVDIYLQPGGNDTVAPLGPVRDLTYSLPAYGVTLKFQPLDFVQVNGELNRKMVSHVIDNAGVNASDTVLDLFCGLGNFSLPLATCAARVVGVEGDHNLVARARENAEINNLSNVEFCVANLFEPESQWPWLSSDYDVVLIDPPRAGAQEILPLIGRKKPRVIAYVSCHPATLARDAAELVNRHGYRLAKAGIMDMFPHTSHVESVALFEQR